MLGGEAYAPEPYQLAMGLHDLGRLLPPRMTLNTSDGHSFRTDDDWQSIHAALGTPAGQALVSRMAPAARVYLAELCGASRVAECPAVDV